MKRNVRARMRYVLTIAVTFLVSCCLAGLALHSFIKHQLSRDLERETSRMELFVQRQIDVFKDNVQGQVYSHIDCLFDTLRVYDLCREVVNSNVDICDMAVEYAEDFFPDRHLFMPFWMEYEDELMHGDNVTDKESYFYNYAETDGIFKSCMTKKKNVWSNPYIEPYESTNSILMDYAFPVFDKGGEVMAVVVITNRIAMWEDMLSAFEMYDGGHLHLWVDINTLVNYSPDEISTVDVLNEHKVGSGAAYDFLREVSRTHEASSFLERSGVNTLYYASYVPEIKMVAVYDLPALEFYGRLHQVVVLIILIVLAGGITIFRAYRKLEAVEMNMEINARAMQNEMEAAASIQKQMLPGESANLGGLEIKAKLLPAKVVGGDFYDFLEHDGRVFFCIGDVSGKGTPAALLTARAVTLFRTIARVASTPSEIARYINENLCEGNDDMMFATMLIGAFSPAEGRLVFCNAAHNPAVIWNSGKAEFLQLRRTVPVAIQSGFDFTDEVVPVEGPWRLLAYTDGITEAMDKTHKLYGEQRLMDFCRAHPSDTQGLNEQLLKDVEAFVDGFEQSDDITLLDVKF